MEKNGEIEIAVSGTVGNSPINPDNFDIRDIVSILENVENLLYSGDKKSRPVISYEIREGSVRNIFRTSIQAVVSFNAILGLITTEGSIDYLNLDTAKAVENLQELAQKKDFCLNIRTSLKDTNELLIDNNSKFKRSESVWAQAEFYLYGKITNAGGKDRANIHLLTEEHGTVRIQTPIEFLEQQEENILYKTLGIRVKGKQNVQSGEMDMSSLEFVQLIDYNPVFDEEYLAGLRVRAKKSWLSNINADSWLGQIRGYES